MWRASIELSVIISIFYWNFIELRRTSRRSPGLGDRRRPARLPKHDLRRQHRIPLALGDQEADLGAMTTATKPRASRRQHPQLDPPGAPPRVAVAPSLQDRDHVVIRSDDDTDEDYEARCRVFAAALAFAHKG